MTFENRVKILKKIFFYRKICIIQKIALSLQRVFKDSHTSTVINLINSEESLILLWH